ncbi:hypothetical protein BGW38_003169 [Lunasporangiospora selenospora]|uniref:C2H2-type domain-containing protein n=1 Tax=Lunasporangiospora selenospora TaxID=979761 RepID=A0A9P6FRK4_9FUNG|nr:hypothetical protein BGW38_003169 [Lunasporangiospora selenospora]
MHPHLPHAPSTQPLFQHSQPLQSQFLQEPSAFAPAPSMGAHMQNVSQYEAPSSLDCYLESLGQSFGHPSVLSLVDPPSVDNGDASRRLGADLDFSSGASSLVLSPTMSWISATPSRDNSPEPAMNASLYKKHLFRPPVKRRGSSLYSKSGGKMARSKSAVPHHAPMGLSVPTAHHAGATEPSTVSDCALPQPSADRPRKRRARQIKLKAKPTSFVCDSPGCGKVFSRAYNLTSHMKTHSSERPFLCGSCPLAFARRHDRERHVRLHTGEKPYPCESCGCGFMRNDALHRHQRICGQSAAALLALMQQQQQQRGPVEGSSSGATSYQDLFGL